ncbi:hypothetical protein [Cytobacillus massiliigabonensis]|uniref:hypothetical protein n=1 Tax=Cytobacillus massiliigabonensis TaxID=1871011 RepID=UPI001156FD76|nr:hypothetical protein [Cytobacillus massiliigabonensis]
MLDTNKIFPNNFLIAKTENIKERINDVIATFDGKYGKSKIPVSGKNKIKMLINKNIDEKRNASMI